MDSPSNRERSKTTPRWHSLPIRPAFPVAAILAVMACRLLPHPPNLTSVVACALFAGAHVANNGDAVLASLLFGTLAVAEAWCPTLSECAAMVAA